MRTHVSVNGIAKLYPRPIISPNGHDIPLKPPGFWYEVGGDWRRFCAGVMPHWISERNLYRVDVADDVRLLRIESDADFERFQHEYVTVARGWSTSFSSNRAPDWLSVAESYDGIEIAPYNWDRRMDPESFWYSRWDCASGVLWNPRDTTVTFIEKLPAIESD